MAVRVLVVIALVWWFACASAQEPPPATTLPELQQRLAEVVNQAKYEAALWGVKVVSLDTGKALFEHNADKLFSPASNSKLYTVALALDRLGENYRIKTSLYATATPRRNGTLKGDLLVYGRGDPTWNLRLRGTNILTALEPLVAILTNAGVRRIAGDLIGDESYFHGPEFGSGWSWDDMQYYYGAEVSALTINDNVLQVTVKPGPTNGSPCALTVTPATPRLVLRNRTQTVAADGRRKITFYRPLDGNVIYVLGTMPAGTNTYASEVTLDDPAMEFASLFREALAGHGIKVRGKVKTLNWLDCLDHPVNRAALVELGAIESPFLREIAREIQKPSQNLYTDLLLAHVGEAFRTTADAAEMTSENLGIRELNRFLAEAGVPRDEVFFEEGSGLSRNNLTTPNATVALLKHMSGHKCAQAFIDALPVAGVDGTLRNRMKNTAAAGNVRAKTGTLRWASSLSGYVTSAAGERLVFSLMLNRYHPPPGTTARADLDAIAILLARFSGRS